MKEDQFPKTKNEKLIFLFAAFLITVLLVVKKEDRIKFILEIGLSIGLIVWPLYCVVMGRFKSEKTKKSIKALIDFLKTLL
jgi:hypothetical protein